MQTERYGLPKKAHFRLILLLVNLDTSQIIMLELEKMIIHLFGKKSPSPTERNRVKNGCPRFFVINSIFKSFGQRAKIFKGCTRHISGFKDEKRHIGYFTF